ncbi:hypothetical protein LMH87_011793 [Akanthomyces muscarius]|uniref:BCAS2 family protein n=1 Tax=Akanthomyces muscarius TaxID=2231603 RepID=A0A9W8QAG2_AKAMU|nr:hypothetical protein LMH87_011793 [Akanthomyces muscarius]KAJ4151076.1 hypothetical protein LMH87_011793 [Akanthomyces muscarius]
MSIAAYHESLPYIDPEPSAEALAAARALISAELAASPSTEPSSFLAASSAREPSFTPTMTTEFERIAAQVPLQPLNLSRYEAQEPPADAPDAATLRTPLERAYVSASYLAARNQNLQLLDRAGKNAWLLGNYAIEADLRAVEAELAATKREMDLVNAARATRQNEVKGEMQTLEENWRTRVGNVLETEIAVEELRQQVRDELRNQHRPQE